MRFDESIEFQWDEGNLDKNWVKHRVSITECEEVFFDDQKISLKDTPHSGKEERFIIFGKTKKDRILFVVFTERKNKVRIISARDADKKEKKLYETNA